MNNNRLYYFDWIRIFAFFVLILYHTGMYYVTWDWHVKSPHASDAIEPLMILSSPWRLGLLFMISGVATAFMLKKFRLGALLKQRSWRLLVPLIFGMFVIVPPQAYFEVVEKVAYQGGYQEFMQLYVTSYKGFCRGTDCLDMPTWNHLWFVAYLWAYTMAAGLIVWLLGARFDAVSNALGRLLSGWRIIVLPVLVLAAARFALVDRFPTTHALTDDWYNHAHYFFLFALGALLAMQAQFWTKVEALRWTSLTLWLSSWALVVCYWSIPEALANTPEVQQWKPVFRSIYCLCQWAPILTVCGFGHRHLNFDSAKRRYLTEAVFPVYILHQTLIVSMAHWMKPIKLAPAIEGVFLIVLTFAISFGVFEVVRRIAVLRPLFGLGRITSQTSAYAAQAPAAAATPAR
ncbi:acyltransferase family protein [Pseudoduganella sp. FT55W]|uniref:Acyltransferase family protein n=1 Tax=Duganella rivi TaxID=2666083 RepID=A0A7X4GPG6_9BURK|nr:acyltransferase family protein [Duganella rivi]MYM66829.1 acyltransferase family protein [Duganella rivi]